MNPSEGVSVSIAVSVNLIQFLEIDKFRKSAFVGELCWFNFIYLFYFYTLLFHALFKVKFNIDHFVLGEHWEC